MTIALAQGTFDILHPGHTHYLREAAASANQLHVIVARTDNIDHKAPPIIPAEQRREMVEALEMVDRAHLGQTGDMLHLVERIDPDVIVLGHDQHHDEATLKEQLARRNIDCEITRASSREPTNDEILSSGAIIKRILDHRG